MFLFVFATFYPPLFLHAQTDRSYDYASIDITYTVNQDSTVNVAEEQTYEFTGAYHQGERIIPHKGSDAITDIRVVDATTGQALQYSGSQLDKTLSTSWGKYTTYTADGSTYIDWYYNLADTTHTWIIYYTLHGAISFYDDHDELYWNLFSDYTVPVKETTANVILPAADTLPSATFYVNGNHGVISTRPDDRTFVFQAFDFEPEAEVTVAVGWQKGLVDEAAYWRYWWGLNWPYAASAALVILTLLWAIGYWYFTERYHTGRGTIVPQYEPPQNLPPAMAELLVRERTTKRAWPATIVDLAIRNYLSIKEERSRDFAKLGVLIFMIIASGALIWLLSDGSFNQTVIVTIIVAVIVFLVIPIYFGLRFSSRFWLKDYILTQNVEADISKLKPYEKHMLEILFSPSEPTFSTKKARNSSTQQQYLYYAFLGLKKQLADETGNDTHAYEHDFKTERKGLTALLLAAILVVVGYFLLQGIGLPSAYAFLIGTIVLAAAVGHYFVRFEARLTKEGQILREDWLGFKLYLQTAERYRLQNLTPDLFEKFLPYAMIFGVEKKWAKAFDSLNLPPPNWYGGAYVGAAAVSSGPTSFSPSSFTSGFSASFASSFASSGAGGGASGGGGGAGGGGGGGGGGAS